MEGYMLWAVAASAGAPIVYGRFRPMSEERPKGTSRFIATRQTGTIAVEVGASGRLVAVPSGRLRGGSCTSLPLSLMTGTLKSMGLKSIVDSWFYLHPYFPP